jgi:hypothetical protein
MMSPSNLKGKTYADRPATPLGEETGLTSTPVSEHPTRGNTPRPAPAPNPYHYQPAIASTRPEFTSLRRNSSNYAQAQAEYLSKLATSEPPVPDASGDDASSPPRGPGRSYSFSAEDLKRSKYQHLMTDGQDEKNEQPEEEENKDLKSPGIGNSEVKGREYGFTTSG